MSNSSKFVGGMILSLLFGMVAGWLIFRPVPPVLTPATRLLIRSDSHGKVRVLQQLSSVVRPTSKKPVRAGKFPPLPARKIRLPFPVLRLATPGGTRIGFLIAPRLLAIGPVIDLSVNQNLTALIAKQPMPTALHRVQPAISMQEAIHHVAP